MTQTSTKIDLSIVIVNFNTVDLLRKCLHSIYKAVHPFTIEVIVVDNHSSDGSSTMVSGEFPQVDLIALLSNVGFGPGNNVGINKAIGTNILLLNPDTELHRGTLDACIEFLRQNPRYGLIGVRQMEPTGVIQNSFGNLPGLGTMVIQNMLGSKYLRFVRRALYKAIGLVPPAEQQTQKDLHGRMTKSVGWVMGAFMFFRGDVLRTLQGFDESFVMYGEDLDLCARTKALGHEIAYLGDVSILHVGGASMAKVPLKSQCLRRIAMIHYYRKHQPIQAPAYQLLLSAHALFKVFLSKLSGRSLLEAKTLLNASMKAKWSDFKL